MTSFLAIVIALAIALAWPVPLALSHARWTQRSPRAALLAWQCVALGGALSVFGALLGIAFLPLHQPVSVSLIQLKHAFWSGPLPDGWGLLSALALSAAVLFGALLLANIAHAVWVTETKRRQHRSRVDLLSSPLGEHTEIRLLDHSAPMAFCLPGMRNLTVLSSGLIDLFEHDEFEAVLAHERAHLRGQHHLLLLAFRAWHDSLPWFPIASRAELAVDTLIELVADDAATRTVERDSIARAIRRVGGSWDDGIISGRATAFATDPTTLAPRLARLEGPRQHLNPVARTSVVLVSLGLVVAPATFLVLLALQG